MSTVVVDANIGVSLVIPVPYSPRVRDLWEAWRQGNARIVVPTLWHYEVLSSLRKAVTLGLLGTEASEAAIDALRMLDLEEAAPDWAQAGSVLDWADRLGQTVAYGAVYVALAEHMQAQLWTADRRLARAARAAGAAWVHHLGDQPTAT